MKKIVNKFFNNNLQGNEKKFSDIKLIEIIISVLFIFFGGFIFLNKTISDNTIAIILGVLILLEGIINVYSFIKNSNKLDKINIFFGLIYIIIAILMFTNFIKFVNYIIIYFGIFLIISGIKELITSILFKIIKEDSFLILLVMSILMISIGGLIIFYPFASFDLLEIIAIFSILFGLLNLNTCNLLRNRIEKFFSKVDND